MKHIKNNLPYILIVIAVMVMIVLYLDYESDGLINQMDDAMNAEMILSIGVGNLWRMIHCI